MKFLIFILMLIAAVIAEEIYTADQMEKIKTMSNECMESTHVDPDLVKQMRQKQFHDDERLKEYIFCIFKKMHRMDDAGGMLKDALYEQLVRSPAAKKAMEACVDKVGTSGPETAYVVFKCFLEHLPVDIKATL